MKRSGYGFSSGSPTVRVARGIEQDGILALLNSSVAEVMLRQINPTLNTTVSDVLAIPFFEDLSLLRTKTVPRKCIELVESNWDSFELSRAFGKHPMV